MFGLSISLSLLSQLVAHFKLLSETLFDSLKRSNLTLSLSKTLLLVKSLIDLRDKKLCDGGSLRRLCHFLQL